MLSMRYEEIDQDSAVDARTRERELLDRGIGLWEEAQAAGPGSMKTVEAVHFTVRLWTMFLNDLANEDNALSVELRSSLISIGIWMLKECERVRQEVTTNYSGIIEITKTIRQAY